jgi:hypothetical protein
MIPLPSSGMPLYRESLAKTSNTNDSISLSIPDDLRSNEGISKDLTSSSITRSGRLVKRIWREGHFFLTASDKKTHNFLHSVHSSKASPSSLTSFKELMIVMKQFVRSSLEGRRLPDACCSYSSSSGLGICGRQCRSWNTRERIKFSQVWVDGSRKLK